MATQRQSKKPPRNQPPAPIVPLHYAGKWIAWNSQRTQIVGAGMTIREAQAAAQAAGEPEPGYEWVPPADRRI